MEPYDFKHKRPNLKVSAALFMEDGIREFTRLPGRRNNLVDASGTPLPETALQSVLSGLSIDDYRKLLCLDDATIEEGGDEITNSKGDIGRLLFSAAAGVSDLTDVLDAVDQRAAELYRKGGSKSAFALLKRSLDDTSAQIRDTDVSVMEYRQRKQALEAAKAAENDVRALRRDKLMEQASLEAIAKALPMSTKVAELELELKPLQHFPTELDIDPEELVDLSKRRVLVEAERKRLNTLIAVKTGERDQLVPQPEMTQVQHKLNELRNLRGRCGTAAPDLPRRQSQRDDVIKDMKRGLADIGLKSVAAPDQFVFDLIHLQELEKNFQSVSKAVSALRTAKEEEGNAQKNLEAAEKTLGQLPTVGEDGQDLQNILSIHNASHILVEANKSGEALRLAQRSAREALSALSLTGQRFDTVPELSLSFEEVTVLASEIVSAKSAVKRAEDDLLDAEQTAERLIARINALEVSGALISDEEASRSRSERDSLWHEHLGNLSRPSANLFETAMRLDDTKSTARYSQVKDLAEVRQLNVALAEAKGKSKAMKVALKNANDHSVGLISELENHKAATGLEASLSTGGFTDWVRKAETARAQAIVAENERVAAEPVLDSAEILRKELAEALNAPQAKLEALVALASKTAAEREKVQIELRAGQKSVDDAKTEYRKRIGKTIEVEDALKDARTTWSQLLETAFGEAGINIIFPEAFETFRELREFNEKLLGLTRQIDGMERDENALDTALTPLIKSEPGLNGMPLIDAYDAISAKAESAAKTNNTRAVLSEEIETAQKELETVLNDLKHIDEQVRLSAAIFDATILTETVEEFREAVLHGKRAIDLRAEIRNMSSELCSLLGVQSKLELDDALEGQGLTEIQAATSEIVRDLKGIEVDLTTAIETRTRAKSELDSITGEADVATLVARRQTIELEMESVIHNVLKLRIGHMLADTAIRRYRDVHRSGMMKAAEIAFTELTNGKYRSLTTQIDGTNEILVAIQTSDGAAKQAYAMSKGTRFQLYLALRAAAYEQMATNGTILPFFCDDVFETFDEDRTRAACGLMRRIGLTGQAVYLTHHRHVVDIAKEVCGTDVRIHEI
ncbi:MAG: AAA family ATPase [Hyphomicrobiales bacterium]